MNGTTMSYAARILDRLTEEEALPPPAYAYVQPGAPVRDAARRQAPRRAPTATDEDFNKIVNAIYRAEGGDKARYAYGIRSIPYRDKAHARQLCFNTVRNNFFRWLNAGAEGDFLTFLARRYCPIGADNDPRNLNQHWLKNVRHFLAVEAQAR